jgi:hypothetical protein
MYIKRVSRQILSQVQKSLDKEINDMKYELLLNECPQEFSIFILKSSISSHHSSQATYQNTVIIPYDEVIYRNLNVLVTGSV